MPISITRYVDITSGVGGSTAVPTRDLIGRFFTDNVLLATDTMMQFSNAAAVGTFFGVTSEEYARAVFYFSFISKNIVTPPFIQFARYDSAEAGGVTAILTNSAAANDNFGSFLFLNNVNAGAGLTLSEAIAAGTWNLAENNQYLFCALVTSSTYAAWTNDSTGLGLLGGTALTLSGYTIPITGTTADSVTITAVSSLAGLAIGNLISGTGIPAGAYIVSINAAASSITISAAATNAATETLTVIPWQFPEQIPMMVAAATNYYAVNSVQNYMFQGPFASLTPLVTTDAQADIYDPLSVNYYGSTQSAGQILNFYQTGMLQGASPSPLDMTSYVNEIWLKSACTAAIVNLLVALAQLPANQQGRSQILTSLQSVINQALLNGTISVNKALTVNQQQFITGATNDPDAWYQVQSIGYWLDAQIVPSNTSPVVYTATYTLIYSKDDVIRKVTGTDILI